VSPRRVAWPALVWILILTACTVMAYGRSVHVFFSQDDFVFLARAAGVSSAGGLVRSLAAADHFYRPVPRVALFVAELRLFGLNASGFHLVNLGLHTGNVLLLFLLCRRLSGSTLLAGLAGVFFAAHHVPFLAIYWVSGAQDLCMVFFLLLSLHLCLRWLEVRRSLLWAAALLAFAFALLSKEPAVTFPLIVLLFAFIWQRQPGTSARTRQFLWCASRYAVVLCLYLLVRSQKATESIQAEGPYAWALSPGTVLNNLYTYLCDALGVRDWLAVAPQRAAWVCGCVLALVAVTFVASRRYRAPIALGLAWFAISLLPMLFLTQRAYSYYAYLPLAGMAIVVGSLVAAPLERIFAGGWSGVPMRRIAGGAFVSLCVVCWLWFSAGQIRAATEQDPAGILSKSVVARQVSAEVQSLYPTLPTGSTLYVEGLTERNAWAVGNGDMFRLYYPGVVVVVVPEGETSETVGNRGDSGYVYRFGGDR